MCRHRLEDILGNLLAVQVALGRPTGTNVKYSTFHTLLYRKFFAQVTSCQTGEYPFFEVESPSSSPGFVAPAIPIHSAFQAAESSSAVAKFSVSLQAVRPLLVFTRTRQKYSVADCNGDPP